MFPMLATDAPWWQLATVAVLLGVGFGWALERAGLGSSNKLGAQFGGTDFTVLKVMFTALLTAMLGMFVLRELGVLDASAIHVPECWLWPQTIGGVVFGFGLALSRLCPGTACVSFASGRIDGALVMLGLFVGMTLTGLLIGQIETLYLATPRGAWTLPNWLGLAEGTVVAMVVALALAAFAFVERLEPRS